MSQVAIAHERVHLTEKHHLDVASMPLCPSHLRKPLVWLVGAHGGAGVTSLAAALAPMGDAGRVWPAKDTYRLCVLVGRTTREGLERLHDAALQARAGLAGDVEVLGAILVADTPGGMPKSLQKKLYALESVVPRLWRIDYVPAWREALIDELAVWSPLDEPSDSPRPRKRCFRRKPASTADESVPAHIVNVAKDIVEIAFRKAQRKELP